MLREFNQVEQVHALFEDTHQMFFDNFLGQRAAFSPGGLALGITNTIYAPSGPTPTTGNNPTNVGGWLDAIGSGMLVLKDIVEVGTIILAAQPGHRAEPEPKPSLGGGIYSLIADGFLFSATVIELAGGRDDGSPDLGLDIKAPLHDYENQLTVQLANAVGNIDNVRDLILTDPTTLSATAMNREDGAWQLTRDQKAAITSTFSAGLSRDLWPRELGAGFQLWRWPRLPNGYAVSDIKSNDNPAWIYTGQPDGATVLPIVRVDGSGAPASRANYTLTRTITKDNLSDNRDRIVRTSIMNAFYQQTGLTIYDLPALDPLRTNPCETDWPFPKVGNANFTGLQKHGSKDKFFYYISRRDLVDWTNDCAG